MIRFIPNLDNVSAYKPPWVGIDRSEYLRLDLNENTRPIPDEVTRGLGEFIRTQGVHAYPDYTEFTKELAAYVGVSEDQLLVTNGSDQGIDIFLRSVLAPGDPMVVARPEFPIFSHVANLIGAEIVGVPYEADFRFPHDAFARAITPETRLIVVINPNNPTGTAVELDYIERLLKEHPSIPVLVDEAYVEYTRTTAADLLPRYDNLVLFRTFSKAYSMAGLRLGYVLARPEVIRQLKKVRGPFDVNCVAMQAARLQIANPAPMRAHVAEVMNESKPKVVEFLRSRGVPFTEGAANFLLLAHPDRDALVAHLKAERILVRPLYGPMLDGIIRMSLGTPSEMDRLIEALDRFLKRK